MQSKLNVSLRQIAYFKAIGEVGSFRGAAERLGVTQPTLTAQIATL
ncbi:MAG: LysR family transcriptional regulator, partial [Luminiphilus sp.]|nr:LysR family transcriptional regulator [Luminiphilus sp.]